MAFKGVQELTKSKISNEGDHWVTEVASGATKLTYGLAKGVGSAVGTAAKSLHSRVTSLFGGIKNLFSSN